MNPDSSSPLPLASLGVSDIYPLARALQAAEDLRESLVLLAAAGAFFGDVAALGARVPAPRLLPARHTLDPTALDQALAAAQNALTWRGRRAEASSAAGLRVLLDQVLATDRDPLARPVLLTWDAEGGGVLLLLPGCGLQALPGLEQEATP